MTGPERRRHDFGSSALLVPALAIFAVFVVGAGCLLVAYSLTNWRGYGADMSYVGLDNYRRLFSTDAFSRSLGITLVFTVAFVVLVNCLGLVIAILIAQPTGQNRFLRALFFLPSVLPAVAVGFIWRRLFEPGGIVPAIFGLFGEEPRIFSDNSLALSAVIWTAVWQTLGLVVVLLIARIVTIPRDLYEAAALDGAGAWARARFVTLPLLVPTIFVAIVFTTVTGLREFDRPVALTDGGPARATEMIAMRIMDEAFQRGNFGLAAAQAVVLMLITAVVAFALHRAGRALEHRG